MKKLFALIMAAVMICMSVSLVQISSVFAANLCPDIDGYERVTGTVSIAISEDWLKENDTGRAFDGDGDTSFWINCYGCSEEKPVDLIVDFGENPRAIEKIYYKPATPDYHYMSLGCWFQGSNDGEIWENYICMTGYGSNDLNWHLLETDNPVPYRYIRFHYTQPNNPGRDDLTWGISDIDFFAKSSQGGEEPDPPEGGGEEDPDPIIPPDEPEAGELVQFTGTPLYSGEKHGQTSFPNDSSIVECFDGDDTTQFRLSSWMNPDHSSGGYVGLDFGEQRCISQIKLLIGDANESWHMKNDGSQIQVSNNGEDYVPIYTFSFDDTGMSQSPNWYTVTLDEPTEPYRYVRLYSVGCYLGCFLYELQFFGEVPEQDVFTVTQKSGIREIEGTVTDDVACWGMEYVNDNDTSTVIGDPAARRLTLDMGEGKAAVLKKIRYYPRDGYAWLMDGAVISGSNDNRVFEPLAVLPSGTQNGEWYEIDADDVPLSYRYFKFEPAEGHELHLAELHLYGVTDYTISYHNDYLVFHSGYSVMNTTDSDKSIRAYNAIFNGEDFVKTVSSTSDIVSGTVKKTVDNEVKIVNTGEAFTSKLIITDENLRPLADPITIDYTPYTPKTEFELPNFFINDMVVQRGEEICIYGAGLPGVDINVTFNNVTKPVTVDENGDWKVYFDPMEKGGPYQLSVESAHTSYQVDRIYVGDVLLCAGQSNMNVAYSGLQKEFDFVFEDNDNIKFLATTDSVCSGNIRERQFDIAFGNQTHGAANIDKWQDCTEGTAKTITAVGYAAAYELSRCEPDLPIGIIMAAEGGTGLESYITGGGNWNGRFAPFIDYPVAAILWYQGESNQSGYAEYADKQAELINQFRKEKNDPDLPFIYAQLTRCNDTWERPLLRDAQRQTLNSDKLENKNNVGMVVTIDTDKGMGAFTVGDSTHVGGKWAVGQRFAEFYKKFVWGQDTVTEGPLYKSSVVDGSSIIVSFDGVNEGLAIKDVDNSYAVEQHGEEYDNSKNGNAALCEFEIAGSDKVYYPATAEILSDNTVKVYSDRVSKPMYVRYAHQTFPMNPNLVSKYTEDGEVKYLPASPFTSEPY